MLHGGQIHCSVSAEIVASARMLHVHVFAELLVQPAP